jgi:hypothetical protein
MAKFKVTLEFHYDSEEDVSEWNTDVDFDKVETKEQAEEMAKEEIISNGAYSFDYKVEEIK